jgi:hypothetical protein
MTTIQLSIRTEYSLILVGSGCRTDDSADRTRLARKLSFCDKASTLNSRTEVAQTITTYLDRFSEKILARLNLSPQTKDASAFEFGRMLDRALIEVEG